MNSISDNIKAFVDGTLVEQNNDTKVIKVINKNIGR